MTCLHCGAINKDTANFCKDCGMKFTTQKEQDIGTHEDRFYEIAMEELESKSYIKALWAKAFSQSDADEQRAKALYIKFRVQSLKEELMTKRKLEEEKKAKREKIRIQEEAEERERKRAYENSIRIQKEAQKKENARKEKERMRIQEEAEWERMRPQREEAEKIEYRKGIGFLFLFLFVFVFAGFLISTSF